MLRIAIDDATLPESKSPIAAARSPEEAFWRPRTRSPGA